MGRCCWAVYRAAGAAIIYPFILRPIRHLQHGRFCNGKILYDAINPFEYGGPAVMGRAAPELFDGFLEAFHTFCRKTGIVSEFLRLHPYLTSPEHLARGYDIHESCQNISVDLQPVRRGDFPGLRLECAARGAAGRTAETFDRTPTVERSLGLQGPLFQDHGPGKRGTALLLHQRVLREARGPRRRCAAALPRGLRRRRRGGGGLVREVANLLPLLPERPRGFAPARLRQQRPALSSGHHGREGGGL